MDFEKNTDGRMKQGGIVQTAMLKIGAWSQMLPAIERQGIADALDYIRGYPEDDQATTLLALQKVVSARARTAQKASFDRKKRTLIGARVNRDFADLCKEAAKASGKSVTKWCYAALTAAIIRQMKPNVENDLEENGSNDIWYGWR